MMLLYVAGPMTGLPDFNYPVFNRVAELLTYSGYLVENPTVNGPLKPPGEDYHWFLKAGLAQVLRADGVALLDGWEASGGARLEVQVAATIGLPVKPYREWLSLTPTPMA